MEKQKQKISYNGIGVTLEPKVVRVENFAALDALMRMPKAERKEHRHCLVCMIREEYERIYGKELLITHKSLDMEIWAHYKVQVIAAALQKVFKKSRFLAKVIGHTEIIDCGEKSCDNNRFIWDLMVFKR